MKEVINGLKENKIINSKNIEDIKNYINSKYPAYDSKKSAVILADALYKIIDRNTKTFTDEERRIIKRRVIRRASARDEFSLDSYDVFVEYLSVYGNNALDESMVDWLNENQSITVTKKDMLTFSQNLSEYNDVSIETAIERAIDDEKYIDYSVKTHAIPSDEEKIFDSSFEKSKNIFNNIVNKCKSLFVILFQKSELRFRASIEYIKHNTRIAALSAGIILIAFLAGSVYEIVEKKYNNSSKNAVYQTSGEMGSKETKITKWEDNLSWELRYMDVDITALRKWLTNKNSLLSDEPYFSAIINAGKANDVNPLLLFAITGQEQSFVPRDQKNAARIANNPFNVYGSWIQYSTNINDSANIAAKTIAAIGKRRPTAIDEIQWVNRKYAQDKRWWVGVRKIFIKIQNEVYNK